MKEPGAKAAPERKRNKFEKLAGWDVRKGGPLIKPEKVQKIQFDPVLEQFDLKSVCNSRGTLQTYQGRVVLRGDRGKDDGGHCALFTEQVSSALRVAEDFFFEYDVTFSLCV